LVTAAQNIKAARQLLLDQPRRRDEAHVALAVAALAAASALLLAGVVVLGPGFTIDEADFSVSALR